MWRLVGGCDSPCCSEQLKEEVATANIRIIFIAGPSGCGKTSFLKTLGNENTVILPCHILLEQWIRHIIHGTDGQQFHSDMLKNCQNKILCIEDIDMSLCGRSASQIEMAKWIIEWAKQIKVVLTGIDIREKCKFLLSHIEDDDSHSYGYYIFVPERSLPL